jgi:AcrR family transcriptional regulator
MFVKPARPKSIPPTAEEARRLPRQERSKQRVERILDAAASIFTEVGYEAATTEAIAARAETSIGSLYQFYPNKRAIFGAIAERYFETTRVLFEALSTEHAESTPLDELIDRSVDAFMGLQADVGFRAIWNNWQVSPEIFAAGDLVNRELAKRTEAILTRRAPGVAPRRRPLVATMIIEVISAILRISARNEEKTEDVAAEAKTILKRYLAPYALERAPPPNSKRRTPPR